MSSATAPETERVGRGISLGASELVNPRPGCCESRDEFSRAVTDLLRRVKSFVPAARTTPSGRGAKARESAVERAASQAPEVLSRAPEV